jgi:hypothetical protein
MHVSVQINSRLGVSGINVLGFCPLLSEMVGDIYETAEAQLWPNNVAYDHEVKIQA